MDHDPAVYAFWAAGLTVWTTNHTQLLLVQMGAWEIFLAWAGLKLSIVIFQVAGITGMNHCTQPFLVLLKPD
jgi:hypothetical protein